MVSRVSLPLVTSHVNKSTTRPYNSFGRWCRCPEREKGQVEWSNSPRLDRQNHPHRPTIPSKLCSASAAPHLKHVTRMYFFIGFQYNETRSTLPGAPPFFIQYQLILFLSHFFIFILSELNRFVCFLLLTLTFVLLGLSIN